jgi:cobalt-zinc-cadmium efflux system protein
VWSLASDTPALSAHVVLEGEPSLHDAQVTGDELRTLLADRFGIAHATLELECHGCDE